MRVPLSLALFGFLAACGAEGPVQPNLTPPLNPGLSRQDLATVPESSSKWSFHVVATDPVTLGLDDVAVTPSGMTLYQGYVNRFDMTGDLVGYLWFDGDVHVNGRTGDGRTLSRPMTYEIQESRFGMSGTFECVGTFKLVGFPGPGWLQYGNVTGCHGTGDFEGMKMKGYSSNENYAGTWTHDAWGEIW